VSRSLIVGTAKDKSTGRRIPASNLETLIITKLRSFLADEGAVLNVIREEHVDGAAQSRLIGRGVKIAKEIESLTPDRIRDMLMTLIGRVDIRPDCVEISVNRSRLVELLGSGSIGLVTRETPENEAKAVLTLTVRARLQRVGREMKMLVENTHDQTEADPALLRIVARAHDIQERLMQKSGLTLHAIASQEHVTPGYVSRLLRLSSLAPDIITAIVNGKNPPQLTAKKLMRLALEIPVDWTAQRKLLGFTHDRFTSAARSTGAPSRFPSGSTILPELES
jgi:site-specific DNA recombinase